MHLFCRGSPDLRVSTVIAGQGSPAPAVSSPLWGPSLTVLPAAILKWELRTQNQRSQAREAATVSKDWGPRRFHLEKELHS